MDFFAKCWCAGAFKRKGTKKKGSSWRIFSLKELHAATNNFNYDHKLGERDFGSVYWGQLRNGSQIAVKRLKVLNTKAEMEFAVEVEMLGRVRHKNLLSLRGYCAEGQELLIVYDYMPNLSLLSHLHGQHAAACLLDWTRRMNIAIGSAEGIAYLHHYATPHIIHMHVKASNVLLDLDFKAQVADFGYAKLVPDGVNVTTGMKGSLGYLAPEYAMWGKASKTCDVYSFGMLLLELATGKKPIEKVAGSTVKRTITDWALPLVSEGKYDELADPKLQGKYIEEEFKRVIDVAAMCAQNAPEKRPTMLEVVDFLTGETKEKLFKTINEKNEKNGMLEAGKYSEELLEADDNTDSAEYLSFTTEEDDTTDSAQYFSFTMD